MKQSSRVTDGVYTVGELIVAKQYSKVSLTQDGQFKTDFFTWKENTTVCHQAKIACQATRIRTVMSKTTEYTTVPIEDVRSQLAILNELSSSASEQELRTRLQTLETT